MMIPSLRLYVLLWSVLFLVIVVQQSSQGFITPLTRPNPLMATRNGHSLHASRDWLEQATHRLVEAQQLQKGKKHEVLSIFGAWSAWTRKDPTAHVHMEALWNLLNNHNGTPPTMDLSNRLLDAWACAAHFHKLQGASQRARELLVTLQEGYEANPNATEAQQPNHMSFEIVFFVVLRREGPIVARRLLAWMEYLAKSNKNALARPNRNVYISLLDVYAQEGNGVLAEAFLRHMTVMGVDVDILCYNIVIKAWTKHRGREAAEHADALLEEVVRAKTPTVIQPDIITFASVIAAWAGSGMRAHAAARAEELLQEIRKYGLTPNTVVLNAVMSAHVKAKNPAAVQRTEELLRQMENDPSIQPDLISYNTHLHALSMHSQRRAEYAARADALLTRMEASFDKEEVAFAPNTFSYNLVIDAYYRSNQAMKAAHMLRRLVKRVEPETFAFNQVMNALAKSSVPGAAKMAEDLLTYMDEAHKSGLHPQAQPNLYSYSAVLYAYSRSESLEGAERAEALLTLMKERASAGNEHLKPNRYCYNNVISAWANSRQGTYGARKAESLLQEMQSMTDEGDVSVAPNIVTYNSVLNAWARSGTRCCAHKAETYLNKMWELYNAGDKHVKPNDLSYNTVINAISKSQNEGKAQKALRLLRRMDKLYRAGNKEARPNEVTYTAVLNSCAFPAVLDPKARRKALDTAIFTLEELQSSRYGHPNQVTYGTFILAIANLLPEEDSMRRDMIERAFQQCCKDGQVGELVLSHLRKAAPADLYEELLAGFIRSGARLSVEDLPAEWRCNVRERGRWKKARNSPVPRTTDQRKRLKP